MQKKLNPIGNHIFANIYGIPEEIIHNKRRLNDILNEAIKKEGFVLLKSTYALFKPYGITFVKIISESSIVLHTYPEYHSIELDITACRSQTSGEVAFNYILSRLDYPSHRVTRTKSIKGGKYA